MKQLLDLSQDHKIHKDYSKLFLLIFSCIGISEILNRTFYFTNFYLSTYISIILIIISILSIIFLSRKDSLDIPYVYWVYALISWNIITIMRGIYNADNYWDWKFLIYTSIPALLTPLLIHLGNRIKEINYLLHYIFPYYFIITLIILLPINLPQIVYLWTPIYFLILCFPYMHNKQRFFLLIFIIILLTVDLSARSNIIRTSVCIILVLMHRIIKNNITIVKLIHKFLFILPIILFLLAISGNFNIFDMSSYMNSVEVKGATGATENLTSDTRTFLYDEVLKSMKENKSFLFGEGGCGSYYTNWFYNDQSGNNRYATEVGILNTLLYSGIIGVVLFAIVFYLASSLAIGKSNNTLAKTIGLFIIFRWDYCFVEEFTTFNTNYFFLWLMIGLCFSRQFRSLSDKQIKQWIQQI